MLSAIPQLNTTFIEPLHVIERHFLAHRKQIQLWFDNQWLQTPPPLYGSVDLRNAGFKLAPIDMNLFPGGFNNLNPEFLSLSISAAQHIISKTIPGTKHILIIPESHTRNLFYWENIKILQTILLGTLSTEILAPQKITLASGDELLIEPLQRQQDKLLLSDFTPDLIVLNNDLSEGIPAILQNLSQPVLPPAELGWSQRLKSEHFQYYAKVTEEFAQVIGIDPWLITPLSKHCGEIDFMQQEGLTCLIQNAETLFSQIEKKYAEYKVPHPPFLIVKADAGTYGMAVMTVRSVDELRTMNRKQRTRMSTIKGGQPVRRVIIQEGIYTFETFGEGHSVAEPVVYLWGECVVGGFYRVHKERGNDENLNAPGMQFEPLAFAQSCNEPNEKEEPDACPNRFFAYGVVAQLSMLAAAREMKESKKT